MVSGPHSAADTENSTAAIPLARYSETLQHCPALCSSILRRTYSVISPQVTESHRELQRLHPVPSSPTFEPSNLSQSRFIEWPHPHCDATQHQNLPSCHLHASPSAFISHPSINSPISSPPSLTAPIHHHPVADHGAHATPPAASPAPAPAAP